MYDFLLEGSEPLGRVGQLSNWVFFDYWRWTGSKWDWICRSEIINTPDPDRVFSVRQGLQEHCGAALARLHDDHYVGRQGFVYDERYRWLEIAYFVAPPGRDVFGGARG